MRSIRLGLTACLRVLAGRAVFEAVVLLFMALLVSAAHAVDAVSVGPHINAAAIALALPATVVTIISAVAVIVVPIISVPINKVILNLTTAIDNLPAWIKQIVVGIVTTLLTLAAQHVPGVPTSLQGFDVTAIASLLNTGITFLLHYVQSQPATPAAPSATRAPASSASPSK